MGDDVAKFLDKFVSEYCQRGASKEEKYCRFRSLAENVGTAADNVHGLCAVGLESLGYHQPYAWMLCVSHGQILENGHGFLGETSYLPVPPPVTTVTTRSTLNKLFASSEESIGEEEEEVLVIVRTTVMSCRRSKPRSLEKGARGQH